MKPTQIQVILMIFVLALSSCATILNSPKITVNVITAQPANVVVAADTLLGNSTKRLITIDRSKENLKLTFFADSVIKTVFVKSSNSAAFWANLVFFYGVGMLVDRNNPKRYAYPNMVYVDLYDNKTNYSTFIPINSVHDKYRNIIKFTPLKLVDLSNPSLEFSYERRTSQNFSTQFMASYLLPTQTMNTGEFKRTNVRGYRFAVEERFYFKKSAPFGPYIGLELDYLNSNYVDNRNFRFVNSFDSAPVPVNKQTVSINFKTGYQLIFDQLALDFYAGLGLRYKNIQPQGNINLDGIGEANNGFFGDLFAYSRPGERLVLSIPLNFRIGWTF